MRACGHAGGGMRSAFSNAWFSRRRPIWARNLNFKGRTVSMDSVAVRFRISTRHRNWNEIIYEITPAMEHFTLLFTKLSKTFNCCKMIGSHARCWNDLALSGDFISFHHVGNNARGVSPWWNYFLLSHLRFMKKVQFFLLTWRSNKYAWHSDETTAESGLISPVVVRKM
jgi:hypothetical protein